MRAVFFVVTPDTEELTQIAELVDAGHLEVLIADEFPLAAGRADFESAGRSDRRPGKTVLVIAQSFDSRHVPPASSRVGSSAPQQVPDTRRTS